MSSIKVYARVRPPIEDSNPLEWTTVDDQTALVAVRAKNESSKSLSKHQIDRLYDERASNADLYDEIGTKSINSMLKGFSVTMMAYGATGSGKTWSLWGPSKNFKEKTDWGLIPRIVEGIMERFKDMDRFTKTSIEVSFLQDYKGDLEDLLAKRKKISLRNNRPYGAVVRKIKSSAGLASVLEEGSKYRAVASHVMNEDSSRSHAIFQINAKFFDVKEEASMSGTIYLFDLAGCERAGQMDIKQDMMKEAQYINKSLSTLAQVMSALAHNTQKKKKKGKQRFVPFRDTLLTQCLKPGITGDTITSILLTLAPTSSMQQDLLARSVLEFGETARRLKVKPKKNKKVVSKKKMGKNAKKLRAENSKFKQEQGKQALEAKEKLKKRKALMGVKDKDEEEKEKKAKELAQKKQALVSALQSFEYYLPSVKNDELLAHPLVEKNPDMKQEKDKLLEQLGKEEEWISEQNNANLDDLSPEQMDTLLEETEKRRNQLENELNPQLDKIQEMVDAEKEAVDKAKQSLAISVRNNLNNLSQLNTYDPAKKEEMDKAMAEVKELCNNIEQQIAQGEIGDTAEDFDKKKEEFLDQIQPLLNKINDQVTSEKNATEEAVNNLRNHLNNVLSAMGDVGDNQKDEKEALQKQYDDAKANMKAIVSSSDDSSKQDPSKFAEILETLKKETDPIFAKMDQTELEQKNAKNAIYSLLENAEDKLEKQYHPHENDAEMKALVKEMNDLLGRENNWIRNNPSCTLDQYNEKLDGLRQETGDLFSKLNEKKAEQGKEAAEAREDLELYADSKKEILSQFAPRDPEMKEEKENGIQYADGYKSWIGDNPNEHASVYNEKKQELQEAIEPIEDKLKENKKKEKEEFDKAYEDVNNYLNSVQKIFDEKGDKLDDDQKQSVKDALDKVREWLANEDDKTPSDLNEKLKEMEQQLDGMVEDMLKEEESEDEADEVEEITGDFKESSEDEEDSVYNDKEMLSNIFSTEIAELKRKFEGLPATLPEITRLCIIFPPNKKYFMDLGGFEEIIPYMDEDNKYFGHCVLAASALSQIADSDEARERARKLNACSLLKNVLTLVSATQSHVQVAARATEQLADGCEENALLLQEHLLESFIEHFKETQNQNSLEHICSAFNKLSEYNNVVQDKLIELDAMEKLSKLTYYDSQVMREAALEMIIALSQSSEEFREAFTENNGFATIKNAFIWAREKRDDDGNVTRAEDTDILKKCGGAVYNLIQNHSFRALYDEWPYKHLLRGHILHYLSSIGNFSVGPREPELTTANEEGDVFSYTGSSFYGEMKEKTLGGSLKHQTFRENQQYILTVDAEEGEESTLCFCVLDKTENSTLRKNNAVYVGFHLVHHQDELDDYHQVDVNNPVFKTRHSPSPGENYWIMNNLPKGKYRMIVYATRRDQITNYALSMFTSHSDISIDPCVNDSWLRQFYETKLQRTASRYNGGSETSIQWRNDAQFAITAEDDLEMLISGGYVHEEDQQRKVPMILRLLSSDVEKSPMRVLDLAGSSRARAYTHTQCILKMEAGDVQHVQLSIEKEDADFNPLLRLMTYAMGSYQVEPVKEWHTDCLTSKSEEWPETIEFTISREVAEKPCEIALSLEWVADDDESPPDVSFEIEDSSSIEEFPAGYLKGTDKTLNMIHTLSEKEYTVRMVRQSEEHKQTKFFLRIFTQDKPSIINVTPESVKHQEDNSIVNQKAREAEEVNPPKELSQEDVQVPLLSEKSKSQPFELTAEEQLLTNRIQSLQKELQQALLDGGEVKSLQRKNEEQAQTIHSLENQIASLKKQLEETKSSLLVAQSSNSEEKMTDGQKQELLDTIKNLKSQLSQANANARMNEAKSRKEINTLKQELKNASNGAQDDRVKELEDEVADLKAKHQAAVEAAAAKTHEPQPKQAAAEDTSKNSAEQDARIKQLENQIHQLKSMKSQQEKQHNARVKELENQVNELKTSNTPQKNNQNNQEQEIQLKKQLNNAQNQIHDLEQKLKTSGPKSTNADKTSTPNNQNSGEEKHSVHTTKSDNGNTDNNKSSACVIS